MSDNDYKFDILPSLLLTEQRFFKFKGNTKKKFLTHST